MSFETNLLLWQQAKQGDRDSLAALLQNHQDQIYRFCRAQLFHDSAAFDATQETAKRLIEGLAGFRGEGKLSTWILGIANNVCREYRRLDQRWRQSDSETCEMLAANESSPQTNSNQGLEAIELRMAVAELPERQRTAIVLRYFETLPLREVAAIMDVSLGTVKATLHQAIKSLRFQYHTEDV